jgi:hypothetical protein
VSEYAEAFFALPHIHFVFVHWRALLVLFVLWLVGLWLVHTWFWNKKYERG